MARLNPNDATFTTALQMTGEQVDTGTGTLFGVPDKRQAGTSRLFLVISTGGSGQSAIQKAVMTARQKMENDFSVYSKFLVLDSAEQELESLSRLGIDTLNTSAPGIVKTFVPSRRSEFFKSFVPDEGIDLVELGGSDGANRKRMNGKIKLYYEKGGRTNDQALRDRIRSYFIGDWAAHDDLPIDIMILTGISGGNGSGTFLDIATIAKSACPNPGNVKVYGFIMLPDTAETFATTYREKERLYRNGFAALKELESYESIKYEPSRKEKFGAPNPANVQNIGENNLPFDYPILISGKYNEVVGMIAETIVNAASQSGNGVANFNIESFFSNRDDARGTKLNRSAVSLSGILKEDACPEDSHMYSGIGYAQASIPEKIVIPYIVGKANRDLYMNDIQKKEKEPAVSFCTNELSLTDLQFEQAMRSLLGLKSNQALEEKSLWKIVQRKLAECSTPMDNTVNLTNTDLQQARTVESFLKGYGIEQRSNDGKQVMNEYMDTLFGIIKENAKSVMKKYGPRVIHYLYEGKGNKDKKGIPEDFSKICLKKQIETVAEQFRNCKKPVKPSTPGPKGFLGNIWQFLTKTELTEWISEANVYAFNEIKYNISEVMSGDNGVWKKNFEERIVSFRNDASLFAVVIENLAGFYQGQGSSLASQNYLEFAAKSGDLNGINLCKDASMYKWVNEKISDKLKTIPVEDVSSKLIDSFYEDPEPWITDEPGVARKQFDMVMSSACELGQFAKTGLGLTIQDYFKFALKDVADSQIQEKVNEKVKLIFSQLVTKSKPSLNIKPEYTGNQVMNINIMLPQDLEGGQYGQYIKAAFDTVLEQSGTAKHALLYSTAVDSIVCYQISTGVALASLSELTKWENAYDNHIEVTTHLHDPAYCSLHMKTGNSQYSELNMQKTAEILNFQEPREVKILKAYEQYDDAKERLALIYGTGLSWKNYPSINILRYSNDFSGNENTLETKYRSGVFVKKINEALRTGIIECEATGNVYKYYLNCIPDDWRDLEIDNYESMNEDGTFKRGKALFDFLKEQNRGRSPEYRRQICMNGTGYFDKDGFDFTQIIKNERWGQEKIDETHKLYMMRIMRKCTELYQEMEDTMWRFYPIEQELEEREASNKGSVYMKAFIDQFIYGVIKTDEKKMNWSILADADRKPDSLVAYNIKVFGQFNNIEKKLNSDDFRLMLTFDRYLDYLKKKGLSIGKMQDVKNALINKMDADELTQIAVKHMAIIEGEVSSYKKKYGNEDDPLAAVKKQYGLPMEKLELAERIVNFYSLAEEVYNEQKAMLGID